MAQLPPFLVIPYQTFHNTSCRVVFTKKKKDEMHDGVRKKRRLSSAQTTEVKDTSEIENRHLQIQEKQRDEERILLARASVLKVSSNVLVRDKKYNDF